MASNERYVTTIELNSTQAQDRLKELENRVKALKKAKEEAMKTGSVFDEKELKKTIREFNQLHDQTKGVDGVLEHLGDHTVKELQKALRGLRIQANAALPGTEEYEKAQRNIIIIENRIKELKNGFRETSEEAEKLEANAKNLARVMSNLNGASLNELLQAQKYMEADLANMRPEAREGLNNQLKQVKARIAEIRAEQQKVVHQIDRYDQEIKEASKDMATVKRETQLVNATLKNLSTANVRDLEYSIKIINEQLRQTPRGSRAFDELQAKAKMLRTELEKVRYEGQAQQSLFNRTADFFNKIQGAAIAAVGAVTGLTFTVRRCVEAFAGMDQEMENVRKYTGQTSEEVHAMNEEFKKIDTRTARERLNQLAGDAGRLGISSHDAIMEFVDAADKINVALGDDLGDDAVKTIGKLATSFGLDKTMGLRGAMLATGSAINEVSQNSSAAANYLVDFTARVAGYTKNLDLAQTDILGFAAVMDENLLQDEMAATAFGQLVVKMTTDIETFAKIAGMKTEEYRKLVEENINGAILTIAKSLQGRDMEELGKVFDAMNLNGQRAISVLSTLGQKVDDVAERQKIASKAFEEGTSIIDEFNIQNNTVQAQLEKAQKRFHDLTIELGEKLMPVARYFIKGSSLLIRAMVEIIDFVVKFRTSIITLTVALVAWNAATVASIAWNKALKPVIEGVTVAAKKLWAIVSTNIWASTITGAVLLISVLKDLNRTTDGTRNAISDISKAEAENTAQLRIEQKEVENLTNLIKSQTTSENDKKDALDKLNEKMRNFHLPNLTEEAIKTGDATDQLKRYNKEFERRLKLEALQIKFNKSVEREAEAEDYIRKHAIDKSDPLNRTIIGDHSGNDYMWNKNKAALEEEKKYQETMLKAMEALQETSYETMEERADRHMKNILEKHKQAETSTSNTFTDSEDLKKREAAARKEEAARKKDLAERNKAIQAQTEQELALLTQQYAQGLIDYRTYVAKRDAIQVDGINKRMALYTEEDNEYKKLLNDREQLTLKSQEKMERMNLMAVEREHNEVTANISAQFYNKENSELYMNEVAVNEALYQADLKYMQKKAQLYRVGSEDRMLIEMDIEEMERQHKLEKEREYHDRLQQVREQYLNMANEEQMKIALNGLDALHKAGLIKEEEYQRAKLAIEAQYSTGMTPTEQTSQTASNMLTVASDKAKNAAGNSSGIPIIGTIQQYSSTIEQLKALYANDEQNHAAYLEAKRTATAQFCTELAAQFQAAYDSINQILSAATSLYSAQQDYELQVVKNKYEKQIAAAGDNQRKIKKLQEKQAKEEAAIKTKYNQRAVKIQIAQAIASTAMSAINAYASALQIGPAGLVLAPIAAAMALAAGAIQIAAIKKQAQAQQAGYYEGGYTGGKRYRKEAGVVHEGEFVANHEAVNNPNVRPFLDFIDKAQKNNTIGGLTKEDVSRQIGGGGSVVAPVVNVSTDNEELRGSLDRSSSVNERLLEVIERDGIAVKFPLDSFDRNYKHFQKLNER